MKKRYEELTTEEFLRVLFGFPKKYTLSYTKSSTKSTEDYLITSHIEEIPLNNRQEDDYFALNGEYAKEYGKSKARKQIVKNNLKDVNQIFYRKIFISGTYLEVVDALSFLIDREGENNQLERTLLKDFTENNFDYDLPFPLSEDRRAFYRAKGYGIDRDKDKIKQMFEEVAYNNFSHNFNAEVVTPFVLNLDGNFWKLYDYLEPYEKFEKTKTKVIQAISKYNDEVTPKNIANTYFLFAFTDFLGTIIEIDSDTSTKRIDKRGRPATPFEFYITNNHKEDESEIRTQLNIVLKIDKKEVLYALHKFIKILVDKEWLTKFPTYGALNKNSVSKLPFGEKKWNNIIDNKSTLNLSKEAENTISKCLEKLGVK